MLELGTQTIDGYEVTIDYDEYPGDTPRDWDNLGIMVCWHSRYNLGDSHDYADPQAFIHDLSGLYQDEHTDYLTEDQLERCGRIADENNVILPLYLYDHSGITMNTSGFYCPWDSGQVGYIYISNEAIRKEYEVKRISPQLREKVIKYLTGEVETYDQFIRGDVYCYCIEDADGEHLDSCCGFYGTEHIEEQVMDQITYYKEQERKEHQEQVKTYIRNHVPLQYREEHHATT